MSVDDIDIINTAPNKKLTKIGHLREIKRFFFSMKMIGWN